MGIAGNPAVILIDEFSTGIDAKMKRDMWKTLRNVAHGKAVVITTRTYSLPWRTFVRLYSPSYFRFDGRSVGPGDSCWDSC